MEVATWADQRFVGWGPPETPNAQHLFLYLLTGPFSTRIPGIIITEKQSVAASLGYTTKEGTFVSGFNECWSKLMENNVREDEKNRIIWFIKALSNDRRSNRPANPNVIRGWKSDWSLIPECELKSDIYCGLKAFVKGLGGGFVKAYSESIKRPPKTVSTCPPTWQSTCPPTWQSTWPPTYPPTSCNSQVACYDLSCSGHKAQNDAKVTELNLELLPFSKKRPRQPLVDLDTRARETAELFVSLVVERLPTGRTSRDPGKASEKWAKDLEKLHRIDKQSWDDIQKVLLWSQKDAFWSSNILSGASLRKQFDRLTAQMNARSGKRTSGRRDDRSDGYGAHIHRGNEKYGKGEQKL